MSHNPKADALALWLVDQQLKNRPTEVERSAGGDLHLHQHHYAVQPVQTTPEPEPETYQTVRLHPLAFMFSLFLLSIAISVPLALLGAMVDSLNRPDVQYIQPSRGGW